MIIILALLNDGVIISIAYDHVCHKDEPEKWDMKIVLRIAIVLGLIEVISTFLLFYLGDQVFHFTRATIQTMMYLKLSVAGHLTIFLTRTRRPFWSIAPARILWMAAIGTQTLFVWGYALVWFLINDRIKLLAYRILGSTAQKVMYNFN